MNIRQHITDTWKYTTRLTRISLIYNLAIVLPWALWLLYSGLTEDTHKPTPLWYLAPAAVSVLLNTAIALRSYLSTRRLHREALAEYDKAFNFLKETE